jgi:hypothetical protein
MFSRRTTLLEHALEFARTPTLRHRFRHQVSNVQVSCEEKQARIGRLKEFFKHAGAV